MHINEGVSYYQYVFGEKTIVKISHSSAMNVNEWIEYAQTQ